MKIKYLIVIAILIIIPFALVYQSVYIKNQIIDLNNLKPGHKISIMACLEVNQKTKQHDFNVFSNNFWNAFRYWHQRRLYLKTTDDIVVFRDKAQLCMLVISINKQRNDIRFSIHDSDISFIGSAVLLDSQKIILDADLAKSLLYEIRKNPPRKNSNLEHSDINSKTKIRLIN